ncbi:MAG TPA: translation initiation factor IF-1 [Candidatus Paceibacterota bacterium]|nr:translation initiation factor IF-1 [Candidatus Paceibacterota bacterium]
MRPKDIPAKEGVVMEALPGLMFRVKMPGREDLLLAHLAGKMKINNIRVLPGDRVLVEMSPDGGRGRIIRRL